MWWFLTIFIVYPFGNLTYTVYCIWPLPHCLPPRGTDWRIYHPSLIVYPLGDLTNISPLPHYLPLSDPVVYITPPLLSTPFGPFRTYHPCLIVVPFGALTYITPLHRCLPPWGPDVYITPPSLSTLFWPWRTYHHSTIVYHLGALTYISHLPQGR